MFVRIARFRIKPQILNLLILYRTMVRPGFFCFLLVVFRQRRQAGKYIKELGEYSGKSENEVRRLFYDEEVAENVWRRVKPETEEEILRFYAETEECLFSNLRWHALDTQKFTSRFMLADFCRRHKVKTVLDYGGGAGEYCIFLSKNGLDVTYCDVYGVPWKFSKWRFERRGLPVKMLRANQDKLGKYDLILCTDVLEHVKNPLKVLSELHDALNMNGYLCATFPFSYPKEQHLFENRKYANTIEKDLVEMGFRFVEEDYLKYYKKQR